MLEAAPTEATRRSRAAPVDGSCVAGAASIGLLCMHCQVLVDNERMSGGHRDGSCGPCCCVMRASASLCGKNNAPRAHTHSCRRVAPARARSRPLLCRTAPASTIQMFGNANTQAHCIHKTITQRTHTLPRSVETRLDFSGPALIFAFWPSRPPRRGPLAPWRAPPEADSHLVALEAAASRRGAPLIGPGRALL